MRERQFTSDNASGACPEVMAALAEANRGHAPGYGADPITERATEAVRRLFRRECDVFFVATGTAANALALGAVAPPYGLVACHRVSHAYNDECGAPGFLANGLQLRPFEGAMGKLRPDVLDAFAALGHVHAGKPAAVTLTESTELGTVYTPDELRALSAAARRLGLKVHVDGARLANAATMTGVAELVEAAGADAVSLGGTKAGLLGAEAVVLFDRGAAERSEAPTRPEAASRAEAFAYHRKRTGHLLSKQRFLAAQWLGALETGAWRRNAAHANTMAAHLAEGVRKVGLEPLYPREASSVFLALDAPTRSALAAKGWVLYDDPAWGGTRMVCSWDTTEADVDALIVDLAAATRAPR